MKTYGSKKSYMILGAIVIAIFGIVTLCLHRGLFYPTLHLIGKDVIQIEVHTNYVEAGAASYYHFTDHSSHIEIEGEVNTDKLGVYTLTYRLAEENKAIQRQVEVVDTIAPTIELKGTDPVRIFQGETYQEPGFTVKDNYDSSLSERVVVEMEALDTNQQGSYEIHYTVEDTSGNQAQAIRKVEVCSDPTQTKLFYNYEDYSNQFEEWWFHKSVDHQRKGGGKEESYLHQFDSYAMGPDEKTIYLTFDEGGKDITYIKEIADVLNKHDVKATFFLTRNYIKNEAAFINDLVAHGHVIGNHTWHHYNMSTLANPEQIDQFVLEITETEKTYMQVTGEEMKKVFRFPKGGMSERTMKMVQDLGYTNYFWSHAYFDFGGDVSKQEALDTLLKHYHNGAIYLLHPSNKGNYLAMEDFIVEMKKLGYSFQTVDTIPESMEKER